MSEDKKRRINFKWSDYRGMAFAAFVLFLAIKYWDTLAGVVILMLRAAVPLLIGCAVAYVVNILLESFEKLYDKVFRGRRSKSMKRGICVVMSYLSLLLIIILVMLLIVPQLAACVQLMISDSGGALQKLVDLMMEQPSLEKYARMIQENVLDAGKLQHVITNAINLLTHGSTKWIDSAFTVVQSIASKFTSLFIGIMFSIYVLAGKENLAARSKRVLQLYFPKAEGKFLYVAGLLNENFRNFIVGQVKDACVLGVMCTIGLLILRMPYAAMIGVIIAVTALVPIVGAFIGAAVGAILILSVSPVKALIFLIFFIVIQQVDNNVTYPRIVGDSIGLPGIWILAAVTIGGSMGGILGMLLFIPLFSTIYKIIQADIRKRSREDIVAA